MSLEMTKSKIVNFIYMSLTRNLAKEEHLQNNYKSLFSFFLFEFIIIILTPPLNRLSIMKLPSPNQEDKYLECC